jgi:hypothetical protein
LADAVEKGFFWSKSARLIQDQAPVRNVDSRIHSSPGKTACVAVGRVAAQLGTQLYGYQSDVATPLALAAARPAQRPVVFLAYLSIALL